MLDLAGNDLKEVACPLRRRDHIQVVQKPFARPSQPQGVLAKRSSFLAGCRLPREVLITNSTDEDCRPDSFLRELMEFFLYGIRQLTCATMMLCMWICAEATG